MNLVWGVSDLQSFYGLRPNFVARGRGGRPVWRQSMPAMARPEQSWLS